MEYSIIICPQSGKKLSINTQDGINTIIKYVKYSNLINKKEQIKILKEKLDNINKNFSNYIDNVSDTSISNNEISSNISIMDSSKKEFKKGRFIIIQNLDNSEIFTDNDTDEEYYYYSSEFSDYISDFDEEDVLKKDDPDREKFKETNNSILSEDEIKWGKAPKGYIRKGRFLIKNDKSV